VTTSACASEADLAIYADGELVAAEVQRLEAHLSGCPRCGALVAALRAEARLLARVLDDAQAAAPARRSSWVELITPGLCLLGAAAGLQSFFAWIGDLGPPTTVGVDAQSFVVSLLFDTLFYLVREGASMLTPLLSAAGLVALVVLTGLVAFSVRRRGAAASLVLLTLASLATPALAIERRMAKGPHEEIVVPAAETLDDSLVAMGETVSIDGVVTGNVLAMGQRVAIRGTVRGDLITCAQRVDIAGRVEGNVISFSQTLVVRGPVGQSLHGIAEHFSLDRESHVKGDVVGLAGRMDLEGNVGRDLLAFGGFANLKGDVGRHATSWMDRLRVDGPVKVGGDLIAHTSTEKNVTIDAKASVGGRAETLVKTAKAHRNRYASPSFYLWKVIWLAAAFLTGLLLYWFFPALFAARLDGSLMLGRTLGVGFVALVATPVAIVTLALTMVGLPLAFLALAAWVAGVYFSSILVAALVGRALFAGREGPAPSFAIALLLGLVMVTIAAHLPYVGWLLKLVVMVLGLGLAVLQSGRSWKAARAA
jgi:anti-sigma factor RsiW/cytoskeletal protein CcmA (bactofilin family)